MPLSDQTDAMAAELLRLRQELTLTEQRLRHSDVSRESSTALHRAVIKEISELRHNHQMLTEGAKDGILTIQDGAILYANPAFWHFVGIPAPERQELLDTQVVSDTLMALTAICADCASMEDPFLYEDHSIFRCPSEISCSPIKHKGRTAYLFVIRDISERIKTELLRLKQAEREAELRVQAYFSFREGQSQKAGALLHNIGNAVTGIQSRAESLSQATDALLDICNVINDFLTTQHSGASTELSAHDVLRAIRGAIQQVTIGDIIPHTDAIARGAQHITNSVQDQRASLLCTPVAQPFSLQLLLEDAQQIVESLASAISTQIVIDTRQGPELVILPRNQLLESTINLLKNATEAIADAAASDGRHGLIHIETRKKDHANFEISIVDNGCGFSDTDRSRLFEVGFTSKANGSGLGLHSVANFVQSIGGAIHISSDGPLCGAHIAIVLPISLAGSSWGKEQS